MVLLLLLGLALLPYSVQRLGLEAGEGFATRAPALTLFTLAMAALLATTYLFARKRRIIL